MVNEFPAPFDYVRAVAFAIIFFIRPEESRGFSEQGPLSGQREIADTSSRGSNQLDVIQNLTLHDSIYNSGFTVTATQRRIDRIDVRGPFYKARAQWKLASEGDRIGYLSETSDYEDPAYIPPARRAWVDRPGASMSLRAEAMLASVRIKECGYWGNEASGVHQIDATLSITPDGKSTRVGTVNNSSLYPPRDLSLIASRRSFQWSLGRFFSECLEKVTHVSRSPDGRLQVVAQGELYKGANGIWELEIEPEAAWIVRKARFHPQAKPDQTFAEMINEGTVWSNSFCVPKEARVNFWGRIEDMDQVSGTHTQYFSFNKNMTTFDNRFYEQCRNLVMFNKEATLTIVDWRVSPPAITRPNHSDPVNPTPRTTYSSSRAWFVTINLIAVVGLMVGLMLRRMKRDTNKAAEL